MSVWLGGGGSSNGITREVQVDNALPVTHVTKTGGFQTTLNPFDINMYLEYGPISIYNDDRFIQESERTTGQGWLFSLKIDGATIALREGEIVILYAQIENPLEPGKYEQFSCRADYEQRDTVYVPQINNYEYKEDLLTFGTVVRDAANVNAQTIDHPFYLGNGPWLPLNALEWYT